MYRHESARVLTTVTTHVRGLPPCHGIIIKDIYIAQVRKGHTTSDYFTIPVLHVGIMLL